MTTSELLNEAADFIEEHGWFNLDNPQYSVSGDNPCCALTAIGYVSRDDFTGVRLAAIGALAEAVRDEVDIEYYVGWRGKLIGEWNDRYTSPEPVVTKMREVAALLEV